MSIDQQYLDLKRERIREEIALDWEVTSNAPLLDLPDQPASAGRVHTVKAKLIRLGGGDDGEDWEIAYVSLRGMYVIYGRATGLHFWQDYCNGHRYNLTDLPGWIRSVIEQEIERRSA